MWRICRLTRYRWMPVVIVGVGLLAVTLLYLDYRAFLNTPLKVPEHGLTFVVEPGNSIKVIAQRLGQQGVLTAPLYLQAYTRIKGLSARLKAGEYAITPGTTAPDLIEQIVVGRVIQYTLTVVEGWTFCQLLAAIERHPKIHHTLQGLDEAEVMKRLGLPGEHPEGRFFPDTYHFPAGTSDVALLQRAHITLEQRLDDAWRQRAPTLSLESPYQVLVLASIIEKEAALPNERREIAGVFIRRLQRGMLLQADPTVIYGLGEAFDGNIRKTDLLADNPYNTYVRKGLPPTPISLPGADAIAAAAHPAPGDTLYFVAAGEGRHVFSRTLEEHARAVMKYQLRQP
jgi:UPF0755 protein